MFFDLNAGRSTQLQFEGESGWELEVKANFMDGEVQQYCNLSHLFSIHYKSQRPGPALSWRTPQQKARVSSKSADK
jgi:hypothetical protein